MKREIFKVRKLTLYVMWVSLLTILVLPNSNTKVGAQGNSSLWTVPKVVCPTDYSDCQLGQAIDSSNRLFILDSSFHLFVIPPNSTTYQMYDLSSYSTQLQPHGTFMFIPYADKVVFYTGTNQLLTYTMSNQQFQPLVTVPNTSFRSCNYNFLTDQYAPIAQLGTNNLLLACANHMEGIAGRYIVSVNTTTGAVSPLFEPLTVFEQQSLPWRRIVAGLDGNVYLQGNYSLDPLVQNGATTIRRRGVSDSTWTTITLPVDSVLASDTALNTQTQRFSNLVAVDAESNLYMDLSWWNSDLTTLHFRYGKFTPQGNLVWLLNDSDAPSGVFVTSFLVNGAPQLIVPSSNSQQAFEFQQPSTTIISTATPTQIYTSTTTPTAIESATQYVNKP